jgi:hypothetical protein
MKSQTAGVAQRLDPFRLGACAALSLVDGCDCSSRAGWVPSSVGTKLMGSFTAPVYGLGIFKLIRRVSFFSTYVSIRRCQATESLQRCHDGEVSLRAS